MLVGLWLLIGIVGDVFDNVLCEIMIGFYRIECSYGSLFCSGLICILVDLEDIVLVWVEYICYI